MGSTHWTAVLVVFLSQTLKVLLTWSLPLGDFGKKAKWKSRGFRCVTSTREHKVQEWQEALQNLPEGGMWEGVGGAGEERETYPVHVASASQEKGCILHKFTFYVTGHPWMLKAMHALLSDWVPQRQEACVGFGFLPASACLETEFWLKSCTYQSYIWGPTTNNNSNKTVIIPNWFILRMKRGNLVKAIRKGLNVHLFLNCAKYSESIFWHLLCC